MSQSRRSFLRLLGSAALLPATLRSRTAEAATTVSIIAHKALAAAQAGEQDYPFLTALPTGGFGATWRNAPPTGSRAIWYAQYSAGGVAATAPVHLADAPIGHSAALRFGDGSVRVFQDRSVAPPGTGGAIACRKVTAAGVFSGAVVPINQQINGRFPQQTSPVAINLKNGDILCLWQEETIGAIDPAQILPFRIAARRMTAAGAVAGATFLPFTPSTQADYLLRGAIAMTGPSGGAVIAYNMSVSNAANTIHALKLARLDATGHAVGAAMILRTDTGPRRLHMLKNYPVGLTPLSGGRFAVFHQAWTAAGDAVLVGRIFDDAGTVLKRFTVPNGIDSDFAFDNIVVDTTIDGRIVVVSTIVLFNTTTFATEYRVQAWVFDTNGVTLAGPVQVWKAVSIYHRPHDIVRLTGGAFALSVTEGTTAAQSRAAVYVLRVT